MFDLLLTAVALVVLTVVVLVVGSCVAHAKVSGPQPPLQSPAAVVVLGYPSRRNGKPHPIQRWRCKLAVLSAQAYASKVVVFTGGNPTAGKTEAEVMAALGTEFGLADVEVLLEDTSISTWQNVGQTIPLIPDATTVILVSDPLHAARARSYWLRQHPGDAERVFVTGQSSFFDHWWLKLPTAVHASGRSLFDRLRSGLRS